MGARNAGSARDVNRSWLPNRPGFKVLTAGEVAQLPPGTPMSYGIPKVLTADELWAIASSGSQASQQAAPTSSSASSKPTGQVAVAVALSAEDLSDPAPQMRIRSLFAGLGQHPGKVAAAVNLGTGIGQSICDIIKNEYPTFTPAVQGPVAGLAIIGSSASFWQEMQGDDTVGKILKGAAVAANTFEFLTITGIIPDGGATMRTVCIAVRGADAVYENVRKIKE
jgi:hypothetical protein